MMNLNPMQMFSRMMNPQQIINKMMPQIQNNPILSNALNLAQKGDDKAVEQIARNVCQSRGIDFDSAFKNFMDSMH